MLVLSGAATVASTRTLARLLRMALPDAEHEWLPCLDHQAPVTHAAEVNARIVGFLDRVAGHADRSAEPLRSAA